MNPEQVPVEHVVNVIELAPPAKTYLLEDPAAGAVIVRTHPPYEVTLTALPLPATEVGDTPQPDSVKLALVMPDPELPRLRVIESLILEALVTVRVPLAELEA